MKKFMVLMLALVCLFGIGCDNTADNQNSSNTLLMATLSETQVQRDLSISLYDSDSTPQYVNPERGQEYYAEQYTIENKSHTEQMTCTAVIDNIGTVYTLAPRGSASGDTSVETTSQLVIIYCAYNNDKHYPGYQIWFYTKRRP